MPILGSIYLNNKHIGYDIIACIFILGNSGRGPAQRGGCLAPDLHKCTVHGI